MPDQAFISRFRVYNQRWYRGDRDCDSFSSQKGHTTQPSSHDNMIARDLLARSQLDSLDASTLLEKPLSCRSDYFHVALGFCIRHEHLSDNMGFHSTLFRVVEGPIWQGRLIKEWLLLRNLGFLHVGDIVAPCSEVTLGLRQDLSGFVPINGATPGDWKVWKLRMDLFPSL